MADLSPQINGSRVNGHPVLRRLTVLNVAFPFAPVSPDPVGGAEKVLAEIDRALVVEGHRSLVIAPAASRVAGELIRFDVAPGVITSELRVTAQAAMRSLVIETIRRERPDVVHLHGLDYFAYLPPPGVPVIVTLHSPLSWYPAEALRTNRPATYLHPVSNSQARLASPGNPLAPPIENGVAVPDVHEPHGKSCFTLSLGRICAEKGFADGLAAATLAQFPLLLAGAVFPYAEHEQYFRAEIAPRLSASRRWIGAVHGAQKRRLLQRARCLLVPSKVPETCSLVALEALAAGTPVVAYRVGALPDVVEHGVTGFLVDSIGDMAAAIEAARGIDPEACRARARERFPLERMTEAYLRRYAEVAG